MLKIEVILSESYDETNEQFLQDSVVLELEHSLVSLSKWESKHEKAFLGKEEKTNEDILDYIRCMILTADFPPEVFSALSQQNVDEITDYIGSKQTATTVNTPKSTGSTTNETITSELIYYWLASYQIPFEVETWHLNRLLTLVAVFNAKNTKQKKRSPSELAAERRALNEQRLAQSGGRG